MNKKDKKDIILTIALVAFGALGSLVSSMQTKREINKKFEEMRIENKSEE